MLQDWCNFDTFWVSVFIVLLWVAFLCFIKFTFFILLHLFVFFSLWLLPENSVVFEKNLEPKTILMSFAVVGFHLRSLNWIEYTRPNVGTIAPRKPCSLQAVGLYSCGTVWYHFPFFFTVNLSFSSVSKISGGYPVMCQGCVNQFSCVCHLFRSSCSLKHLNDTLSYCRPCRDGHDCYRVFTEYLLAYLLTYLLITYFSRLQLLLNFLKIYVFVSVKYALFQISLN